MCTALAYVYTSMYNDSVLFSKLCSGLLSDLFFGGFFMLVIVYAFKIHYLDGISFIPSKLLHISLAESVQVICPSTIELSFWCGDL